MEKTLVILKPSTIQRGLVGQVLDRFQRKGLKIAGLKMMQLDEKSYDEIAAVTGLTRNNVAVRLHRAKERLRTMTKELES